MSRSFSRPLMLAAALAATLAASAQAGTVTGNPNADGWAFSGNSLDKGTFVYADPNQHYNDPFNFNVYSTSLVLQSGSDLIGVGDNWQVNDLVIGIGATVLNTGGVLTPVVRFLAKFGSSNATFAPSSYAPPGGQIPAKPWDSYPPNSESADFFGDGVGSSKYSGDGGIVVETPQLWSNANPWFMRWTPLSRPLGPEFKL